MEITMSKKAIGNMVIAQSGGPTTVINESLAGAVLEARKHAQIGRIMGAIHGIKGILENNLIDLGAEKVQTIEAVALTPSAGLGTVRKKPDASDCRKIFEMLKSHNVRFFFYIGGNDSAETTKIISDESAKENFALSCFHIPKTIDNDLRSNDHTPGFGSAAKFVAMAFMGDNLDNRALTGVKINVVMGRNAGFLTAASALARVYPDDGPHLIYLPESPFRINDFVRDVKRVYEKYGRCVIAVSEGIRDRNGVEIAAKFIKEVDSHGNKQLSGSGALGDFLAGIIKTKSDIKRVRADTFGYLQRSFPGIRSETDAREARAVGAMAVREAARGVKSGSIAILRKQGKAYKAEFKTVPIGDVARQARSMPDEYIARAGNDVTPAFIAYARPIVGPLPPVGRFARIKIK